MTIVEQQMLQCLAAFRIGRNAAVVSGFSDWQALYELAAAHKVESIVCETLWRESEFCAGDSRFAAVWQKTTVINAAIQARKTISLLRLGAVFEEQGIPYAVLKGVVCRAMYAQPDLRPSGDEDILIFHDDLSRCSEILSREGFKQECQAAQSEPVTHWINERTGLHLELHTQPFPSLRSGDEPLNNCLMEQLQHTVLFVTQGGAVRTFAPTWHFLFLIGHALKHFIYGGFGIRTLCDVISYFEIYSDEIDREVIDYWLEKIRGRVFFEQLMLIAEEYLGFDISGSGWEITGSANPKHMLEDIMAAGVYGQTTMSRRHSNNLVIHATGERKSYIGGILCAMFPPRELLVGRYPILNRVPVMLPFIWLHRMGAYLLEIVRSGGIDNSPKESLVLGKQRIKMMAEYGIISHDKTRNH